MSVYVFRGSHRFLLLLYFHGDPDPHHHRSSLFILFLGSFFFIYVFVKIPHGVVLIVRFPPIKPLSLGMDLRDSILYVILVESIGLAIINYPTFVMTPLAPCK